MVTFDLTRNGRTVVLEKLKLQAILPQTYACMWSVLLPQTCHQPFHQYYGQYVFRNLFHSYLLLSTFVAYKSNLILGVTYKAILTVLSVA